MTLPPGPAPTLFRGWEGGPVSARTVLVLGPHRSGTSAVTGLLAANGCSPGPPAGLLGADDSNPRGHFENQAVLSLNESLLERLGGQWWSPPQTYEVEAAREDLRASAQAVWRQVSSALVPPPALLKDPRLCLLLPVWRPVLGPGVLAVLCVRDPIAVARSLQVRNGFDLTVGLALWEAYVVGALRGLAEDVPLVVAHVDQLIVDRERRAGLVQQVRAAANLPEAELVDTLEPQLLSGASSSTEHREHLTAAQAQLWEALQHAPPGVVQAVPQPAMRVGSGAINVLRRHSDAVARTKRVEAEAARVPALAAEVEALTAALAGLREQAARQVQVDERARQALSARAAQAETALETAAARATEAERVRDALSDRAAQAEQARHVLAARLARAEQAARTSVRTAEAAGQELQGQVDALVRSERDLREHAQALEKALETARESYSEVRRRLVLAAQAHEALQAECSALRDELVLARAAEQESTARAAHYSGEAAKAHATLAEVFASRSWRWTRPLRGERRSADRAPKALEAGPVGRVQGPGSPRVAVVAHVFYPELWELLRIQLGNIQEPFDLFVSLTQGFSDKLSDHIRAEFPTARVQVGPNRGRDIAPFAALLAEGALDDYSALLKIHTKRSHHREDGDEWRTALWHGLLPSPDEVKHVIAVMAGDPDVGCMVPEGMVMAAESLGSNERTMSELLSRVGLEFRHEDVLFPAGSMYWLGGDVVQLLKALRLTPEDFEPEQGQIDGTTAHAFERVLGALLKRRDQRIVGSLEIRSIDASPEWTRRRRPKVLAFYLPQFHRTAENDTWWGEGFTEWTSTASARSWYDGQALPRVPAPPLGAYDLGGPQAVEVLTQQARLAHLSGIDGFLVYHYWFSGRRLLDAPMRTVLDNPGIPFPYALVWANENWTRAWDGLDEDVLVRQDYAPGWVDGLFASLAPHLVDARYVRLDGRPLVVLFKPGLVPDLAGAVTRLRDLARAEGCGELHVAGVLHDRHAEADVEQAGQVLDSWIEFPPLSGPSPRCVETTDRGHVYDYQSLVDADHFVPLVGGRQVHPGAMPSWDNSPRRAQGAHSFRGANPADFRRWLVSLRRKLAGTSLPGESVVVVNAWNEWAETAYLEPDTRVGQANLEAVRSAFGLSGDRP